MLNVEYDNNSHDDSDDIISNVMMKLVITMSTTWKRNDDIMSIIFTIVITITLWPPISLPLSLGVAVAVGEQPIKGLISSAAQARLTVCEALR